MIKLMKSWLYRFMNRPSRVVVQNFCAGETKLTAAQLSRLSGVRNIRQ